MFTTLCLIGFFALYEVILSHINCGNNKMTPEIETGSNTNLETKDPTKKIAILFSLMTSYLKHFSFVLLQGTYKNVMLNYVKL